MTKTEVENTLKSAIVSVLRLEDMQPDDIDNYTPLFGEEGLQLDSLDAVELVMLVEKYFDVAIVDTEEAKRAFGSISELADFILARKNAT